MKKIAIITARSGSKGLPNKNILNLCGKPLIAYSILAAIESNQFEEVIVSTDSLEYKEISEKYGAHVIMRDEKLASDTATTFDVLKDLINNKIKIEFDYFALLQPTSPLRTKEHIIEAVSKFEKNYSNFDFLVSVHIADKTSELVKRIDEDESLKYFDVDYSNYNRQRYKEYSPNGAFFIGKPNEYLEQGHFYGSKSIAYLMDESSSVDIDSINDFELAIVLMNKRNKKINNQVFVKNRINEKIEEFSKQSDITLIGHSILDNWDINELNGMKVSNYGIGGITSDEYYKYILSENKIKGFGKYCFLMFGTNDIIFDEDFSIISKNINKCLEYIKQKTPNTKLVFILTTKVNARIDRNNKVIGDLNEYLKNSLKNVDEFVEIKELEDKYGNLDLKYTIDGLHLNKDGYEVLKSVLERQLKDN